jgi:hypothetical protein
MSEKIRLKDGKAYRGDKLVAWYDGDELKFKHWKFKALKEEIEALAQDDEPVVESDDPEPPTPPELINMGINGAWFGECHPHVVEWRKKNWSKKAFDKKYEFKYELLCNNYDAEGMKYQP